MTVLGWDIGGVNTKAAAVHDGAMLGVINRPYELQRAPAQLTSVLRELAAALNCPGDARHAVTMTAELSQMFRTKREGVHFVLDAVEAAFGETSPAVYCTDNRFRSVAETRRLPLLAAAANWMATAQVVARHHANAVVVDVGTTTTDIIPIVGGSVVAEGRTDVDRLASRELVYSGALRTPVEALVSDVAIGQRRIGVSAEGFALTGDVHLYRGDLAAEDYTVPTPDGRPATLEFARERLARIVCGDPELLDDAAVAQIAEHVASAQIERIASAIGRVRARHPSVAYAVVTGLGEFIAAAAARAGGLDVISLATALGADAARCAPAAAVALLLESGSIPTSSIREIEEGSGRPTSRANSEARSHAVVDVVVKIGGGSLADPAALSSALAAVQQLSTRLRLLVVPGGGPFADAVREADRQLSLDASASHWMAVLAMDQYAELLVSRLAHGARVESLHEITAAVERGDVPVLAPSRWLRRVDPLPHSWEVTSDSIAAWISGAVGSRLLVLLKPPGVHGDAVDRYFQQALPPGVTPVVVPADQAADMLLAVR